MSSHLELSLDDLAIAVNAWGWMAWEATAPRCSCPFAEGTWLAQHWLAGWDGADEVDGSLADAKPIKPGETVKLQDTGDD